MYNLFTTEKYTVTTVIIRFLHCLRTISDICPRFRIYNGPILNTTERMDIVYHFGFQKIAVEQPWN